MGANSRRLWRRLAIIWRRLARACGHILHRRSLQNLRAPNLRFRRKVNSRHSFALRQVETAGFCLPMVFLGGLIAF